MARQLQLNFTPLRVALGGITPKQRLAMAA